MLGTRTNHGQRAGTAGLSATCRVVFFSLCFGVTALRSAVLDGVETSLTDTNGLGMGLMGTEQNDPLAAWNAAAERPVFQSDNARPIADQGLTSAELSALWSDPILAGVAAGILVLGGSALVLGVSAWRRGQDWRSGR